MGYYSTHLSTSKKRGHTVMIILGISIIMLMLCSLCGCTKTKKGDEKQKLLVLHAGSLSLPFREMSGAFMKKYPDIEVLNESHGSRTCARQITELGSKADVIASADSEVITSLLMPDFADYCIDFTTNEMVIMYNKDKKFPTSFTRDNWYELLVSGKVQYGHSDPNADPCGYRTRLCWQLAEKYYNVPGLYDELLSHCPEKNVRPKEVDLLALLEAGELDMIFIYRSVAGQHNAGYLILPEEINLKSVQFRDFYSQAKIELTGKNPGETITQYGAPMVYGITVPKTAAHPGLGAAYVNFVLSPEGREIMEKNGQPEIIPPLVDNYKNLPESLKDYFSE